MFNLDEEKIEFASFGFWQCKESENVIFFFISDVEIRGIIIVSDSWYCQIQKTRLIMFFMDVFAYEQK